VLCGWLIVDHDRVHCPWRKPKLCTFVSLMLTGQLHALCAGKQGVPAVLLPVLVLLLVYWVAACVTDGGQEANRVTVTCALLQHGVSCIRMPAVPLEAVIGPLWTNVS
jgi:hypothetical protein